MPDSTDTNPILDVLERGCADLLAGRQTHAAAAVVEKFPLIARNSRMRARICEVTGPLPKMIRDFSRTGRRTPRGVNGYRTSRHALESSSPRPTLLPRYHVEFDEIICHRETRPRVGHDDIYAFWSAIPLREGAAANSGKVGTYGGFDRGERRNVDRTMYRGGALGLSYSIHLYEEDRGNWVAAYNEFANNVASFWNEDVVPLLDDVEDALEDVGELPIVGDIAAPVASWANEILRAGRRIIEEGARVIDRAIRFLIRLFGLEDDPFPPIAKTLEIDDLRSIRIGETRAFSHSVAAHGGRYEARVEVSHLPYKTAIPGNTSTHAPALVADNDGLILLWSGSSSRRELNVRMGVEYTNLGRKHVQRSDGLVNSPCAVVWRDKVVVAWIEKKRSVPRARIGVLNRRTGIIEGIRDVPHSRFTRGVSACVHDGRLYLCLSGSYSIKDGRVRRNKICQLLATESSLDGELEWSEPGYGGHDSSGSAKILSLGGELHTLVTSADRSLFLLSDTGGRGTPDDSMSRGTNLQTRPRGPVAALVHGDELYIAYCNASRALQVDRVDIDDRRRVAWSRVTNITDSSKPALCTFAGAPMLGWTSPHHRIHLRPFL